MRALAALIASIVASHAAAKSVAVRVILPGASSVEIEQRLLVPMENAVGAAGTESLAVAGAGWLRAEAPISRDTTMRKLQAAIGKAATIELDWERDGVTHVRYLLADERRPLAELRARHDAAIASRVTSLTGVLDLHVCGGGRLETFVRVDPAALRARRLGLEDVVDGLVGGYPKWVPDIVLKKGVRLRDVARVSEEMEPASCWASAGGTAVIAGEVVARDPAPVRAFLEQAGARVLDDPRRRVAILPGAASDEEALRIVITMAKTLPDALVVLDRSPHALPHQLPHEIVIYGGAGELPPGPTAPGDASHVVVRPDAARLARHRISTRAVELTVTAAGKLGVPAGAGRVFLSGGLSSSLPVGRVRLGDVATVERRLVPAVIRRAGGRRVGGP